MRGGDRLRAASGPPALLTSRVNVHVLTSNRKVSNGHLTAMVEINTITVIEAFNEHGTPMAVTVGTSGAPSIVTETPGHTKHEAEVDVITPVHPDFRNRLHNLVAAGVALLMSVVLPGCDDVDVGHEVVDTPVEEFRGGTHFECCGPDEDGEIACSPLGAGGCGPGEVLHECSDDEQFGPDGASWFDCWPSRQPPGNS